MEMCDIGWGFNDFATRCIGSHIVVPQEFYQRIVSASKITLDLIELQLERTSRPFFSQYSAVCESCSSS